MGRAIAPHWGLAVQACWDVRILYKCCSNIKPEPSCWVPTPSSLPAARPEFVTGDGHWVARLPDWAV